MDSESRASAPVVPRPQASHLPLRPSGFRRDRDTAAADGPPQRGFRAPEPPPEPKAKPAAAATDQSTSPPPPGRFKGNGWRWALAAAAVAIVAVVVVAFLAFRLGSSSSPAADAPVSTTAVSATSTTATTLPVTDVYKQVLPSVVLIQTSKGSLGSGVVVTQTGTILTANHVISDGGAVTVLFADGSKSAATVASADKTTDIAALTPKSLPEIVVPATLGGAVAVGADVVAIGNPFALRDSTTSGVVSGLDRTASTDAGNLTGLIQFDAAVNPGSSGGPLLNNQGSVIGIVVSIADPGNDDAFAGIGFAVPIGTALGGGDGNGPGRGPQI